MNRAELIEATAQRTRLTKRDTEKTLAAILKVIGESLAQGEGVTLVGFGVFSVACRSARTGCNPRTGLPIDISAKRVPTFSAGKGLKEQVAQEVI
jgi:DNA-binding protein HU-beta